MVCSFRMSGGDNALPQLQYRILDRRGGEGYWVGGQCCYFRIIKFETVKAVNVKVTILSEVTPCRLVDRRTAGFGSVLVRCRTFCYCYCSDAMETKNDG